MEKGRAYNVMGERNIKMEVKNKNNSDKKKNDYKAETVK